MQDAIAQSYKGTYGELWVRTVAAGFDYDQAGGFSLDMQKFDVQLGRRGYVGRWEDPNVRIQVKTADSLDRSTPGYITYDMEAELYNKMCSANVSTSLILVIIECPKPRIEVSAKSTTLNGSAYWYALQGEAPTGNAGTKRVKIPMENIFDECAMDTILRQYGRPRTTPAPTDAEIEAGFAEMGASW